MRNKFSGLCIRCCEYVKAGAGHPERIQGKWAVRCLKCVGKGHPVEAMEKEKGQ